MKKTVLFLFLLLSLLLSACGKEPEPNPNVPTGTVMHFSELGSNEELISIDETIYEYDYALEIGKEYLLNLEVSYSGGDVEYSDPEKARQIYDESLVEIVYEQGVGYKLKLLGETLGTSVIIEHDSRLIDPAFDKPIVKFSPTIVISSK